MSRMLRMASAEIAAMLGFISLAVYTGRRLLVAMVRGWPRGHSHPPAVVMLMCTGLLALL